MLPPQKQNEREGEELRREHAEQEPFIHAAYRAHMEQIGRDAVVKEVIRHARVETPRHAGQEAPFDAHESREDDVTHAQRNKTCDSDIPVQQIPKRRHQMPEPKEQCLKQKRKARGVPFFDKV